MKKVISTVTPGIIHFTFDDGLAPLDFDTRKMSPENLAYAPVFGMCHRLGDMAAIPKSKENNYKVTEAMRRAEVAAGIAHYESGSAEWNLKAGARAAPQNEAILRYAAARGIEYAAAMAEIANKALEEMQSA